MHRSALERLDALDIRDAADKAWCATKRGYRRKLILARTGEEPGTTAMTSDGLDALADEDDRVKIPGGPLLQQDHPTALGECFYDGRCDSPDTGTPHPRN